MVKRFEIIDFADFFRRCCATVARNLNFRIEPVNDTCPASLRSPVSSAS
jgi:hypothetical protein